MKKLVVLLAVIVFAASQGYSAGYPNQLNVSNDDQIMQIVSSEVNIYDVQKEYPISENIPENVATQAKESEVQNEEEDLIDMSANVMGIGIF